MGEIDHADDAVDHRVADCDQPVDSPQRQPVDKLLEEIFHVREPLDGPPAALSARGRLPVVLLPVVGAFRSMNKFKEPFLQTRPVRRCSGATCMVTIGSIKCRRSEEHTSELQALMRITYAVFCLKKKKNK